MSWILGLAMVAGCSDDEIVNNVDLTVTNLGSEEVHVYSQCKDSDWEIRHRHSLDLAPGESGTANFSHVMILEVWIYRTSDQFLLFSASWSKDQIEDLQKKVKVTVSP